MTTQLITKIPSRFLLIVPISICCGAALMFAQAQDQVPAKHGTQYRVSSLDSLGGTSSGGNSINDGCWVAGYSRVTGDQTRHAALWRRQQHHSILDLGSSADQTAVSLGTSRIPRESLLVSLKLPIRNHWGKLGAARPSTPGPMPPVISTSGLSWKTGR